MNNIPVERCAERGIVVFNTPGANANAVKELVICGMLLACRDVTSAAWSGCATPWDDPQIAKRAEKAKKRFAGCELAGKRVGVIGLGAIGAQVADALIALGAEVMGYDPYLSINAAWGLDPPHRARHGALPAPRRLRLCHAARAPPPTRRAAWISGRGHRHHEARRGAAQLCPRRPRGRAGASPRPLDDGKIARYVTDFANPRLRPT